MSGRRVRPLQAARAVVCPAVMESDRAAPLLRRWEAVVAAHGDRRALTDGVSGRTWTFAELADDLPPPGEPGLRAPEAGGPDFIRAVLAAWRDGAVLLPREPGAPMPDIGPLPLDTVHVKTTSGSTASPRAVCFSAAQLAADADAVVTTMGLRPDSPNLGVISMAHSYGFSNLVLPLLLHGIPLILVENPLPESLRRALAGRSDLTLPAVPAMWRAWHAAGVLDGRIRLAISAGAPLPLALESAVFTASGLKIHNFYGSSECGGIAYDRTARPRSDAAVAGTPLHGVTLTIDPMSGCLAVRSPAVGTAVLGEPDALRDGCFVTGDLADLAADGTVRLVGRAGDVINAAGRKIAPLAVEAVLERLPGVRHCVVFGVPSRDPARADDIVACLALDPDAALTAVRRAAAAALPPAALPRFWHVDPDLAPDVRGKISRGAWRARWLAVQDPDKAT